MEITLNARSKILTFNLDNTVITQDIEQFIYNEVKEDGTKDYSKPFRDISDEGMDVFSNVLCEMAQFRKREYDSGVLIEYLFDKLPEKCKEKMIATLTNNYDFSEQE